MIKIIINFLKIDLFLLVKNSYNICLTMTEIDRYILAVQDFNAIKSFVITLPKDVSFYNRLVPHIEDVQYMTQQLILLEERRKNSIFDNELASTILTLVVHLNQISNGVK